MSMEKVVERILSDANAEAQSIVSDAEKKAAEILADASSRAERSRRETEREVREKSEGILAKRAADARLESAKLLLSEKRSVVDAVYEMALARLIALEKSDVLALTALLLERYAETGDEIFFAENFKYAEEAASLPVIERKSLKISEKRLPIDGGMQLVGAKSDKDLSYGALLFADREDHQAELAAKLFK